MEDNKLSEKLRVVADEAIHLVEIVETVAMPLVSLMEYHLKIAGQIKVLRKKQQTLGLTYSEKQRLKILLSK